MDVPLTSFIGIDVAKRQFDVFVSPQNRSFSLPNNPVGIAQLLAELPVPGSYLIVVEATGVYQRSLVIALVDQGHQVAVVNP